jgi:hypothetical protein
MHSRSEQRVHARDFRRVLFCFLPCLLGLTVFLICPPIFAQDAVSLFQLLNEEGIRLTESEVRPLQSPTFSPALSADEQLQKLGELAGSYGWEKFSRDSVVAPIKIDLDYILDEHGDRIGHDVHAAFIAHAPFEQLRDEDLMRQIFGKPIQDSDANESEPQPGDAARDVPIEELSRLGIELPDSENERYATMHLPLLNKITVRGTLRIAKREGDNWLQLYWYLDPRFAASEKYANTWTKILRNDVGMPIESEPHPYAGCGGYVCVAKIAPSSAEALKPDASRTDPLLVESRMIMLEPSDWFAGSNALRSKLPLMLQENARDFRRHFAK